MLLPEPTIRRLPWYLAFVSRLNAQGVERVSTTAIARQTGVDAPMVSKDLARLEVRGKTRVGYEVRELEKALESFLGYERRHKAVLIGAGSLGRALMGDQGLGRYGLEVVAGFDVSPTLTGHSVGQVPIWPLHMLQQMRQELGATIAVLAVPPDAAQEAAETCQNAGFRAIWNFTPSRLSLSDDVVVQNVSIYSSLAILYNKMDNRDHQAATMP